ncbi:MAG: hypothetical protein PVJ52_01080 [Candidatus Woesebacteria bacterium]|jgi:hypothetical protein
MPIEISNGERAQALFDNPNKPPVISEEEVTGEVPPNLPDMPGSVDKYRFGDDPEILEEAKKSGKDVVATKRKILIGTGIAAALALAGVTITVIYKHRKSTEDKYIPLD